MKFREQISTPGLVIGLMTAILILAAWVGMIIILSKGLAHIFHSKPNWPLVAFESLLPLVYVAIQYRRDRRKSRIAD
jgi:hypothetical protein